MKCLWKKVGVLLLLAGALCTTARGGQVYFLPTHSLQHCSPSDLVVSPQEYAALIGSELPAAWFNDTLTQTANPANLVERPYHRAVCRPYVEDEYPVGYDFWQEGGETAASAPYAATYRDCSAADKIAKGNVQVDETVYENEYDCFAADWNDYNCFEDADYEQWWLLRGEASETTEEVAEAAPVAEANDDDYAYDEYGYDYAYEAYNYDRLEAYEGYGPLDEYGYEVYDPQETVSPVENTEAENCKAEKTYSNEQMECPLRSCYDADRYSREYDPYAQDADYWPHGVCHPAYDYPLEKAVCDHPAATAAEGVNYISVACRTIGEYVDRAAAVVQAANAAWSGNTSPISDSDSLWQGIED